MLGQSRRWSTRGSCRALWCFLAGGQLLRGGGGADRRLGEPRRGAPVVDRFAALRFYEGA